LPGSGASFRPGTNPICDWGQNASIFRRWRRVDLAVDGLWRRGEPGCWAEFLSATAVLNGNMRPVEHRKNEETYYVNEIGTDRTMAVQFPEPNRMKLMMPHRFKAEIVVLYLSKVPATP
jgi:hypothetical protein